MSEISEQRIQDFKGEITDQFWRLNNLYYIVNENGKKVKFELNWAQEELFRNMWYWNVVLKARQLGFTTFIDLFGLDCAIFNTNFHFGIIADHRDNADSIFKNKIKYPYEKLPESLRAVVGASVDRVGELQLTNDSVVRVGTSLRSGTYQMVHVSEYGKVSVRFPEKAKEIKTGSLETVHHGNMIFIESTGEGTSGEFYDVCSSAKALKDSGRVLTLLDYKFFFFPWWRNPAYSMDPTHVVIGSRMQKYFADLEIQHGIELSRRQKAWYTKKEVSLGEAIKQEHPSTPEEAFEATTKGAYFAAEMNAARQQGRITSVPHISGIPVDTWWDLGMADYTVLWFTQTVGREIHVINYFEDNGNGLKYYARRLSEIAEAEGYRYGTHNGPHDLEVREQGPGKTRRESAAEAGLFFNVIPRIAVKADAIEAVRSLIPIVFFDETRCDVGIKRLENYRKQWDTVRGVYRDKPLHDDNSHGADAFQTLACGHEFKTVYVRKGNPVPVSSAGWT